MHFFFFLPPTPAPASKSVHLEEGFGTVGENNIYTVLRFLPIFHTTHRFLLTDSNTLVKLRTRSRLFLSYETMIYPDHFTYILHALEFLQTSEELFFF